MKKNIMMRLAAVLLVSVMLTTSVVGGTFAKYTTAAESKDTARVAKWGVTIEGVTADKNNLFAMTYDSTDGSYTGLAVEATEDVVAPGTEGEMTKFTIKGTPEVAVRVSYAPTFKLNGWNSDDATEYCPIVFVITKDGTSETYGTKDTDATNQSTTVAELETAVKNAIISATKDYVPNTNLDTGVAVNNDLVVSWYWNYEGNDVKDTALGDRAAKGNAATIQLDIKVTIDQID